jgi:hypothetical protein
MRYLDCCHLQDIMLVRISFRVDILEEFDFIQRLIEEILRIFYHFQAHPFISSHISIQIYTLPSSGKGSLLILFRSFLARTCPNISATSYRPATIVPGTGLKFLSSSNPVRYGSKIT